MPNDHTDMLWELEPFGALVVDVMGLAAIGFVIFMAVMVVAAAPWWQRLRKR